MLVPLTLTVWEISTRIPISSLYVILLSVLVVDILQTGILQSVLLSTLGAGVSPTSIIALPQTVSGTDWVLWLHVE